MKKTVDMINGKIVKNMILFAIPVILGNVLQILYSSADSFVVGRYDSALALGAVGITSSIVSLFISLFVGMSLGTNVLVARFYGKNDKKMVKLATDTGIIVAIVAGILCAIAGIALASPLAYLIKIDEEIIDMSILYMKIYFLGVPFTAVFNAMAAALRGIGDSKNPMYCMITTGALNVVLNIIFVKFLKMGVAGVATATVISQAVSVVMVFFMLRKSEIGFRLRKIGFEKKMCLDTIMIGLPTGLQGVVFCISTMIMASGVNYFGAAAVTGDSIVCQIEGLLYAVASSITQTVIPFASQNLGAKKIERINKIFISGLGLSMGSVAILSVVVYIFRYNIIEMFSPSSNNDPALQADIIKYALAKINWAMMPYFTLGFMETSNGMLRGIGRNVLAMITGIGGVLGIRVSWLLIIFPIFHTAEMLYVAYPISWTVIGIINTLAYIAAKRQLDRQHSKEKAVI